MARGSAAAGWLAAAIATAALVVLAARADSEVPGASRWLTASDIAVGLAFVVGAAIAPGSRRQRGLTAAVGAAWLIGSFAPSGRLLHQGMLVVALVAFPAGWPRGVARWLLVGLAVPVALLLVAPPGVAALYAAVAVTTLVTARARRVAAWYPAAAALAVAAVLAGSWSVARLEPSAFDPTSALVAYELVLLAVAIGFPVAARAFLRSRARLADEVLGDERLVGLEGLGAVLGDALGDPSLRVYRWEGGEAAYVDSRGVAAIDDGGGRRWLHVADKARPLGAVEHRSGALGDPPTAAAVSSAVRLAVVNVQLQEELQTQLDELEAARARIVAATDRQRAATATRLRGDVVGPLEQATSDLRAAAGRLPSGEGAEALGVVVQELAAATGDIAAFVAGVPPTELGGGRLRGAVEALAERSAVPVTVTADGSAASDPATEMTLFYVCSEALVNAVKHAGASRIDIAIGGDDRAVEVTIADDGCGGADPTGSGLQGLADRLAAAAGSEWRAHPEPARRSPPAHLARRSSGTA